MKLHGPFKVGNLEFQEAGHFDPSNGEIVINARNSYYPRMSLTNGIVAHEISHAMWDEVQKAQQAEHREMDKLVDDPRLYKKNGYPRPEAIAELRERFPVSAMIHDTLGDVYLSDDGKDSEAKHQQMQDEDGHSAYSRSYWTKEALSQNYSWPRAIDETLAEVTRYLTHPMSWHESGDPKSGSPWVKLSQDVRTMYAKIKAKK